MPPATDTTAPTLPPSSTSPSPSSSFATGRRRRAWVEAAAAAAAAAAATAALSAVVAVRAVTTLPPPPLPLSAPPPPALALPLPSPDDGRGLFRPALLPFILRAKGLTSFIVMVSRPLLVWPSGGWVRVFTLFKSSLVPLFCRCFLFASVPGLELCRTIDARSCRPSAPRSRYVHYICRRKFTPIPGIEWTPSGISDSAPVGPFPVERFGVTTYPTLGNRSYVCLVTSVAFCSTSESPFVALLSRRKRFWQICLLSWLVRFGEEQATAA
mmetsp:Transcript_45701/g.84832  ORF Transcript_45701/g.84832 Transcript_45701/m.84832 type:complete len:269 (-) Transcript_45701:210-1016(-)